MKTLITFLTLTVSFYLTAQTQLITNGNFTQSTGWITIGDFVYNTSNPQYNFDPGYAYTSNTNNSNGQLQQGFTIPATSTSVTLTLYHKISTDETTSTNAYDVCDIEIIGSSSSTILKTLSNLDASSSYVSYTTTIPSSYFGQTVSLLITADNDGGKPTRFRFDNISVTATTSSGGSVDIITWNNTVDSTSIFPGNVTNVACDLGYQSGSLSSSTSLYVGYYLSSDQLLDGSDLLLDDDKTTLSSTDPYDPEDYDALIPSNTLPGNYYILFVADMNDDVSESNENNNVVAVPITVKGTTPSTGSLTVTITPSAAINDGALWQLNNGGIWHNSGSALNLSPGVYTVSYKTISGWNTPPAQTVTVVSGGVNTANGNYTSGITVPTVTVTSPNSFQSYSPGNTLNITANITGSITGKKIEYTTDGINWNFIWGISTTNTSLSYSWTIPSVSEPQWFKIKITADYLGGSISDTTDVFSVITPRTTTFELNENSVSHLYWPFENTWLANQLYFDGQSRYFGRYTSGYGEAAHLCSDYYSRDYNKAKPFKLNTDSEICAKNFFATLSGTVIFKESDFPYDCDDIRGSGGYGNQIVIQSIQDTDFAFRVSHLNYVLVDSGDAVYQGQRIGIIGSTGNSDKAHAHCTLYKDIYSIRTFKDGNGSITTSFIDMLTKGKSGTSYHISHCSSNDVSDFAAEFIFDASPNGGGGAVSVDENAGDNEAFSIYPNPATGIIRFSTPVKAVTVINSIGVVIFARESTKNLFSEIDISDLERGVYIIVVQHEETGLAQRRLIKI